MILQSLLAAGVLVALGWPSTGRLRGALGWGAALVAAACVALAAVVPVTFALLLAGMPWHWALLAGALAAAALSRTLAGRDGAVAFTAAAEPTLLRRASLALLLACAALFIAKAVRAPLWSWDHFAIWGVKARRLLDEGGLELGFLAWPELAPGRVDHPLGLPLTWLLLTLGRPPEPADFKALHLLMGIGLLLVVRAAVRRATGSWTWGNLAAAAIALSPLFWDTEAVGLAELPLALWAACGAALLLGVRESPRTAAAGGLVLGFLPWIKSEGFPLAILLFAALAWRSDRAAAHRWRSTAAAAVALSAGLIGAWCVGRFVLPPGVSFFLGDWLERGVARLSQVREIVLFCAQELLAWDWLLFWPVLAVGWLLAALRRRWRAAALATAVWLQVAIYGGTAFFTYLDPIPHLQAAFFRICAALVPLGLIALAVLLGEEVATSRARTTDRSSALGPSSVGPRPRLTPPASASPVPHRPPDAGSG